jgi:hypothetical protein
LGAVGDPARSTTAASSLLPELAVLVLALPGFAANAVRAV